MAEGKKIPEAKQIGQQAAVGPQSGKVPPLKSKGGGNGLGGGGLGGKGGKSP